MMNEVEKNVVEYGQALAGVLRAFDVLEQKAGWFERMLIKLLRGTYRQRLRYLVGTLPADIGDKILGVDRTFVL